MESRNFMIDERYLISKSRPLLAMKNSGYNMAEFKILDTYLSRINPMDPSTRRVKFTHQEYCDLLGVESGKIRSRQLASYTAHFLSNVVSLPRPDRKAGYIQMPLFTFAEYDEEAKEIVLECNSDPQIFGMFFSIEEIGYVKYILKNTKTIKSLYSFKLYMLLKEKLPAVEFSISLEELKEKLEITASRYDEFKFFNSEVLKKAHKEINTNTDTRFEYELIRTGRTTTGIRFKGIRTLDLSEGLPEVSVLDPEPGSSPKKEERVKSKKVDGTVIGTFEELEPEEAAVEDTYQGLSEDVLEALEAIEETVPEDVHKHDKPYIKALFSIVSEYIPSYIEKSERSMWIIKQIHRFNEREWYADKRKKAKVSYQSYYKACLGYWLEKRFGAESDE